MAPNRPASRWPRRLNSRTSWRPSTVPSPLRTPQSGSESFRMTSETPGGTVRGGPVCRLRGGSGAIGKELRARELIERVLIVVPASLQLQWQSELRYKFNEEFEILDGAALQFLGRGGRNPWMARPNVICSLPFAANPKRAEQI